MTFWSLMPRKVTKYLSQENQGRDGCKQTILDSEEIFNAADNRNKLIMWDKYHKRWARLDAAEQTKYVFQSLPRCELSVLQASRTTFPGGCVLSYPAP